MTSDDVQRMRNVAVLMAETARFNAQIEGMKAENAMRSHRGEAPAYVEDQFQKAIDESGVHWNAACTTLAQGL